MAKVPKAASRKQTGSPAQRSAPERKASSRPSPKGKGHRRGADLTVKNPDAAGIDVGARVHYVAVPEDRAQPSIRSFGAYTAQLEELVQWLQACGIKTVAMESTGVYWIALYQKLEAAGFEVLLVDARRAKHVPGRKSDVQDCRWLQQLHSYGLLAPAFRPEDAICRLRSLQRHRKGLVECAAMWIAAPAKGAHGDEPALAPRALATSPARAAWRSWMPSWPENATPERWPAWRTGASSKARSRLKQH
jgi:hypothetical protein